MDGLENFVPKDTIIRVLLKKVKLQEGVIADLEDELGFYEHPKRFLTVLETMNDDEVRDLKRNPYFKQVNALYAKKEKEVKSLTKEVERLNDIIKTYDMIY